MPNLTQCIIGAALASLVTMATSNLAMAQLRENPAWTIMKPEPALPRKSEASERPTVSPHHAKAAPAKRPEFAARKGEQAAQQHQRKFAERSGSVSDKTDAAAPKTVAALVRPPHRMVIQVSQNDAAVMNMALNNAENLTKYYEGKGEPIEIEVVAYGPGLHMLRSDTSPEKGRLAVLAMENMTFSACGNTLNAQSKQEGKEIKLVPEARIVPAGIARIMELQEQHWTYVRP